MVSFSLLLLCAIVLVSALLRNIPECPCWWSHCPLLDFFCHKIHFSATQMFMLSFLLLFYTNFVFRLLLTTTKNYHLVQNFVFRDTNVFTFFPLPVVLTLSWSSLKHSNMSYRVSFVMIIPFKFQVQKFHLEPSSRLSSQDFESLGQVAKNI